MNSLTQELLRFRGWLPNRPKFDRPSQGRGMGRFLPSQETIAEAERDLKAHSALVDSLVARGYDDFRIAAIIERRCKEGK